MDTPENFDISQLTAEIEKLSKVGALIASSRLKERTIMVLLHDMTGIKMQSIKQILDALPQLEKEYLKPARPLPG